MTDAPQIYLISPAQFVLSSFATELAALLDDAPVACMRLALASTDQDEVRRVADALRVVCHDRDVPLVIADHYRIAAETGLDGVHLPGTKDIRAARKHLGDDAIIGSFGGASRHTGMTAGEMGANYVSFGPVTETALGSGAVAETALFQWWTDMIEVPVVAEGAMTDAAAKALAPCIDFLALGDEIWSSSRGARAALAGFRAAMPE